MNAVKPLLIVNARLVNEGKVFESDLLVRDGRISKIASSIEFSGAQVIDANGRYLMPGMIDDQVHFREPGMPNKADIATESRAAVAGGITSYMDMPNTIPNALDAQAIEGKKQIAAKGSMANYAFYLGASNNNIEVIKSIDPSSVCGVKVFMGASTGNMLVDQPEVLEEIFKHAPTLIATHCEDTPMILENEEKYRGVYGDKIPFHLHPLIRSEEACYRSSSFAVDLAKKHGTKLHILHISTAKEVELFSDPSPDKHITAEACVHFLHFSAEDYAHKGALIKCNPAIKTAEDRAGIITGLLSGKIDVIGTDHAPHTWEEKYASSYFQAPSGLPLVQFALPIVLEHYHDAVFDMPFIVSKTSHAVAERFGVIDRGYLREGYYADLVLVDTEKGVTASHNASLSKCEWTPFDGYHFRSSIHTTVVNGTVVWQQGELTQGNNAVGRALKFTGKR